VEDRGPLLETRQPEFGLRRDGTGEPELDLVAVVRLV
jgi:hypothetical protein